MSKGLVGTLFDAVRHDVAGIHDGPGKHGAQARVPDATNGLEGTIRMGIEEIVLAESRHTALYRLYAGQQAPGIEMVRAKNLS